MNADETANPYLTPPTLIACPVCGHQCAQIGNVAMFRQQPGVSTSDYFRLDAEHGVVAINHNDLTRPVRGRMVVIEMHGDCGHNFDLVIHNPTTDTRFYHASQQPLKAYTVAPVPDAPPPVFLSPALWMAFLAEVKEADDAAHGALLVACPLLDRPRHLVLCYSLNVPKVVEYMRKKEVRATLIGVLDELAGKGWTVEILTSHFLNTAP